VTYPDRLLDKLPADDADGPESVAVAQETIELAYLLAVQHLAPRPRTVLILRDDVRCSMPPTTTSGESRRSATLDRN
jgi:DNA-directed RNA polymerase specialized sigma24 family protein